MRSSTTVGQGMQNRENASKMINKGMAPNIKQLKFLGGNVFIDRDLHTQKN